jgi:hypothetical protein
MAATTVFTTSINLPGLQKAKMLSVYVDEDGGRMEIQANVLGGGGILQQSTPWTLRITNGSADALVADPAAPVIGLALRCVQLGGAGVATAFTTALAAYRAGGGDKRNNLWAALRGMSGTVTNSAAEVGALSGTVQPIIPPGAES